MPASPATTEGSEIRIAIAGRPNVGKSSLLNRLAGEERAVVSPIAGTTRDAVDTLVEVDGEIYRFVDTAGHPQAGKASRVSRIRSPCSTPSARSSGRISFS